MTREQYEKDKSNKIAAGKVVLDLTQPKADLPSMFREEISAYEITNESLWRTPRGEHVGFGGFYDRGDYKNKAVLLTPAFLQLVGTGAGITAAGEPEIEKQYSVFKYIMPSGREIGTKYVWRVVGRIAFKRLTPSGNPEVKYYTTEIDVDALLNKAIIDDLEKVGTYDKYEKGPDGKPLLWTEENIKYSSTNVSRNSQNKLKKLNELGQHAYQKVDTKLRSHGQEKFIGIPNITENMIGATIYVSRISYNTDDASIARALAIGAVQDILGMKAPSRLIEETTSLDADSSAEPLDVTDIPLDDDPADGMNQSCGQEPDTEPAKPADQAQDEAVATAAAAAESGGLSEEEGCMKVSEWINSGTISDKVLLDYINAVVNKNCGILITAPVLAGLTLLSKGDENTDAAYKQFLVSAKQVYSGNAQVVDLIEKTSANFTLATARGLLIKTKERLEKQ